MRLRTRLFLHRLGRLGVVTMSLSFAVFAGFFGAVHPKPPLVISSGTPLPSQILLMERLPRPPHGPIHYMNQYLEWLAGPYFRWALLLIIATAAFDSLVGFPSFRRTPHDTDARVEPIVTYGAVLV